MSNSDWCSTDSVCVCGCVCAHECLHLTFRSPSITNSPLLLFVLPSWCVLTDTRLTCAGSVLQGPPLEGESWIVEPEVGWGVLACPAQTANWLLYTLLRGRNKGRRGWRNMWEEMMESSEEKVWWHEGDRKIKRERSASWREAEGADGSKRETDGVRVTKEEKTRLLNPAAVSSCGETICPLFQCCTHVFRIPL